MLGEPRRTQYDLNFAFLGFPVRIHPLFWLVAVLMGGIGRNAGDSRELLINLLAWVLAFFISIFVHEMGHAVATRFYGFHPWIVLYGFGGVTCYSPAHRDVNRRPPGSWGSILISFAGPLAGFLMAAAIIGGFFAFGYLQISGGVRLDYGEGSAFSGPFLNFIGSVLYICIFWGLVNLLPIYPLDGGQIAREVCMMINRSKGIRWSLILSFVLSSMIAALSLLGFFLSRDPGLVWIAFLFGMLARSSYETLGSYNSSRWDL
jgi:stage IV sporulation protein FB